MKSPRCEDARVRRGGERVVDADLGVVGAAHRGALGEVEHGARLVAQRRDHLEPRLHRRRCRPASGSSRTPLLPGRLHGLRRRRRDPGCARGRAARCARPTAGTGRARPGSRTSAPPPAARPRSRASYSSSKSRSVMPSVMRSPWCSSAWSTRRRFTLIPFVEPRSTTCQAPSLVAQLGVAARDVRRRPPRRRTRGCARAPRGCPRAPCAARRRPAPPAWARPAPGRACATSLSGE